MCRLIWTFAGCTCIINSAFWYSSYTTQIDFRMYSILILKYSHTVYLKTWAQCKHRSSHTCTQYDQSFLDTTGLIKDNKLHKGDWKDSQPSRCTGLSESPLGIWPNIQLPPLQHIYRGPLSYQQYLFPKILLLK